MRSIRHFRCTLDRCGVNGRQALTLKNRMPQNVLTIGFACTMSDAAYPAQHGSWCRQHADVMVLTHTLNPWRLQINATGDKPHSVTSAPWDFLKSVIGYKPPVEASADQKCVLICIIKTKVQYSSQHRQAGRTESLLGSADCTSEEGDIQNV